MYDTHYFTIHKTCPCQIENEAVRKTKEIFNKSSCLTDFVAEMQNQQIIGRLISYDKETNTIFIHKRYACECGGGHPQNKTRIGERCHCGHYNHSTAYCPKYYCKCGAEFFLPVFAPLFGEDILIEPYKTVLSGDDDCIIAIRINEREAI